MDKTALSYWFPLIEKAGLPVPKTKIVRMSKDAQASIWEGFDGKPGTGAENPFMEELTAAAVELGFPVFLRTDHTSGKHEWDRCCFLKSADDVRQHVFNLAEHSVMAGIMGLPWDTWVVREFLPTMPLGVCPYYGNMPVCREFRYFVDDDHVKCGHPYWPREALEQGGADKSLDYDKLCHMINGSEPNALAKAAGCAVGGAWSVDILETKRGWFVTDMAEASKSFHWPECPYAGE
jgi:hypothetical protein